MSLDPRYIVALDLNPYLVDKDTGAPLAGGTIEFWQDDSRETPKTVYTLTGSPPNYTYTALPNPITLSAVGTIADANGANVPLYYFPYESTDASAPLQLYYIVVKNANGVIQFTREGWPNTTSETNPAALSNNTIVNMLSNPQFIEVFFDPNETLSITKDTGTYTIPIAPDWILEFSCDGPDTIQVSRAPVAGTSQFETNPPYLMTISGGVNTTELKVYQRLTHNPNIWAPNRDGDNGYIGTNIILGSGSEVTIQYSPSSGSAQTLLQKSNNTGAVKAYTETVQLSGAGNSQTADDGYVDIEIYLPPNGTTIFSSVQVVGLENNDLNVPYEQTPVKRQTDLLFNYYKPLLSAKPVNSYLVGWDFPLNPAQINGESVSAIASGANTSNYIWDQTIVFQSADSSLSFARVSDDVGRFEITAQATGRMALIQYLPQAEARQLLSNRLSVMIRGLCNQEAGISGAVSLWYTTDANLPDMTSNESIVATLGADGIPATLNGTWTEVGRSNLGDATFVLTDVQQDIGLSGWDAEGDASDATYFAIVVGFGNVSAATPDIIEIESISLVPGDIPSIPATKTPDQVLNECERYYEKSYLSNIVAGSVSPINQCIAVQGTHVLPPSGGNNVIYAYTTAFDINFKNIKWSSTPDVYIYSPTTGNVNSALLFLRYNSYTASAAQTVSSTWSVLNLNNKRISYAAQAALLQLNSNEPSGYGPTSWLQFHYVIDSRLGVV